MAEKAGEKGHGRKNIFSGHTLHKLGRYPRVVMRVMIAEAPGSE
jgi:hypothetical protein